VFVAAVIFCCVALGVTLTLVFNNQDDNDRSQRCQGTMSKIANSDC
jgi:hypothetical protein